MSCLPLIKHLQKLKRVLRMFHSSPSSSYRKLCDVDRENDTIDCASNRSPSSSGYGSAFSSPSSSVGSGSFALLPKYDNYSGNFNVNSLADALFEKLESSSCKPKPYSPLNDFSFALFDTSPWNAIKTFEHDEVRKEFEQNGMTMDFNEEFNPSISSTPLPIRKLERSFPRWYANNQQKLQLNPKAVPFTYQKSQQNIANKRPCIGNSIPKRKIKPNKKSLQDHCVFCKNNGENEAIYMHHTVTDKSGRVLCPKLRVYKCPICNADGDNAHTVKYCPKKKIVTEEDLQRMTTTRNLKKIR